MTAAAVDPRVERLGRLYVAAVSDSLDALGYRSQVLAPGVRALAPGSTLCGRAYPIQAVEHAWTGEDSYVHGIGAVDSLPPGAVAVLSTGGFQRAASWGELLATRARARGAVGAVTDGAVRDSAALAAMGFPTFTAGICASDARGRLAVTAHGVPVVCGGVPVHPGDLVLGDDDGVVVVPADVADAVLDATESRKADEHTVRARLQAGESAAAVFEQTGVL